LCGACL